MILSVPLSDCLALNYRRKTIASGNNVLNPRTFPHAVWRSPCRHEICRHANRASGDKLFTRSAETEPKWAVMWTCHVFFFSFQLTRAEIVCCVTGRLVQITRQGDGWHASFFSSSTLSPKCPSSLMLFSTKTASAQRKKIAIYQQQAIL